MQKKFFRAALTSAIILVGSCGNGSENKTETDSLGTPSSSGKTTLQHDGEYTISSPLPNTEINTENGTFTVSCTIKNVVQNNDKFFWISIEDVKREKHWPKFRVNDNECPKTSIQEGKNNSGDKRELNILLLRIDYDTDKKFHEWMKEGDYPGLLLNPSDTVKSVPIFIPQKKTKSD
ncbi:hypothetical protein [Candidatus Parabeggiatoa sp. HSG14]|uniref:hypothetical protein n=1 Tax=Candidatus Parabeggiatoa sp. HSG14 TaxID=3055593 RepID=UPI0025A91345|nr:hypothetical protein [Thiotrichales bacterium HSG14]